MKNKAYDVARPPPEIENTIQKAINNDRKLPTEKVYELEGHQGPVFVVKKCKVNEYVMSGAADRCIKGWNIATGTCLKTYEKGHNHEVFDIDVCDDNKKFASAGGDKSAFVWDVFTGNVLRKFIGHDQQINGISYNNMYNVLVTGSYDATVKIWDLESRNMRPIQTLFDFTDSVTKIQITTDQIICASVDEHLRIYDVRMGKLHTQHMGAPVNGLYAGGDDDYVIGTTTDNKILLYDKVEGKITYEYFGGHTTSDFNATVRISGDNSSIIGTSEDGCVTFYDLLSQKVVHTLDAHEKPVVALDIINTGEYGSGDDIMVTGSFDSKISVWKTKDQ